MALIMHTITIYHNPKCGTSRNTLALIRNAGIEPTIVEYLKTPPSAALLRQLITQMYVTPRELLREKELAKLELDLANAQDDELINAMLAHPILINRPIVVSALGAKLCRPAELVLEVLPVQEHI
jgi:arsenate reductase (glutaredoxin)